MMGGHNHKDKGEKKPDRVKHAETLTTNLLHETEKKPMEHPALKNH